MSFTTPPPAEGLFSFWAVKEKIEVETLFPKETKAEENEVNRRILQCVDKALQPLGEEARRSLLFYARRKLKLRKYEIPDRPEAFIRILCEIYGRSGQSLEKRVILELSKEFQLSSSPSTFAGTVKTIFEELGFEPAKTRLLRRNRD